MSAGKLNFNGDVCSCIEQGANFTKTLSLLDNSGNPMNLTGYTARMQVRRNINALLIIELNTTNGMITISGNSIVLALTPDVTTTLPAGSFLYDLKLTDTVGNVIRLIEGYFVVKAQVTE